MYIYRNENTGDKPVILLDGHSDEVGFMVQAMTDYSFYNYRVMFIFWAYLALGELACRRSKLPEGRRLF